MIDLYRAPLKGSSMNYNIFVLIIHKGMDSFYNVIQSASLDMVRIKN